MQENTQDMLMRQLHAARGRLARQHLLDCEGAGLSLRLPGEQAMLLLPVDGAIEQRLAFSSLPLSAAVSPAAIHAEIYRLRADVGAVMLGGSHFGRTLAQLGGVLPAVFDEQARHLGSTGAAASVVDRELRAILHGGANTFLLGSLPVCVGVNCQRMIFNAELFEKCAKAYVLASAAGDTVKELPWWVRHIARRRLLRDERRAAERFACGVVPEEARGY